ncbi:hypothetical protein FWD20_02720 [Candidatus Saccharibacteria bacterium]|nr:hypothetical protein [Candidatus Saccharibacteria bacterium]
MKGWRRNRRDDPDRGGKVRFDRRILKFLKHIKTWQLLIILLLFIMLAAIFLRLNNLGMVDRREALIEADKTGEIVEVQEAAKNLQNFVSRHMNTSTGRVALQTLYSAAFDKIVEANKMPEVEGGDYQGAMTKCRQMYPRGGQNWANCVADAVGVSEWVVPDEPFPSPDAYYIDYVSPRWSFDLAGVSVLVCFILVAAIVLRLILIIILKIILKFKYRTT